MRARLLPLGALPFRRARPQEPPACQTDLCSQMQPRRREEERRRNGRREGRRSERESRKKGLEGERVEEDLREGEEGGGGGVLVTLQQPSRHTLHVKHSCTETPWESAKERWEEWRGGRERRREEERKRG